MNFHLKDDLRMELIVYKTERFHNLHYMINIAQTWLTNNN